MMVAARTSKTSVEIQLRTRQYIPEYSELQIQGVPKVTQPMEKCNINFIFYYYAYFL
jgi:hypothetical protein